MTQNGRIRDTIPRMTFQVRICNLGKLADATVRVAPLTVLAGANKTGKTVFSKALYSAFDSVNERDENHAAAAFGHRAAIVKEKLTDLTPFPNGDRGGFLLAALDEMGSAASADEAMGGFATMSPEFLAAFREAAQRVKHECKRLEDKPMGLYNGEFEVDTQWLADAVDHLAALGDMSPDELTAAAVEGRFSKNLLLNFQCGPTLHPLRTRPDMPMRIMIQGAEGFSFDLFDDGPEFNPDKGVFLSSALAMLRKHAKVRFLGPPALLQVRAALNNARGIRLKRSSNGRQLMDGVPKWVDDLEELLAQGELSGDAPFPETTARIGEVIGGKVIRDDFGHLYFCEGERRLPLSSAASGVVPLGVLAMLIEKKLVDRGVFLFIDEPESNLHPAWQVEMTEALWSLARGGVNVVLATHSADIMKRLDVYAEEEKEAANEILAVNHFRRDGSVQSGGMEKIAEVQEDLSAPFFALFKRAM